MIGHAHCRIIHTHDRGTYTRRRVSHVNCVCMRVTPLPARHTCCPHTHTPAWVISSWLLHPHGSCNQSDANQDTEATICTSPHVNMQRLTQTETHTDTSMPYTHKKQSRAVCRASNSCPAECHATCLFTCRIPSFFTVARTCNSRATKLSTAAALDSVDSNHEG